ncbi:hypothetical protein PHYSODRAFT_404621, partial [Phytophthora sojae]
GGFLLASLVYHAEYLRTTLSEQHPLYRNALFGNTRIVSQLQQKVVCRTGRPSDRIRPTGVPPHVHLMASMEQQAKRRSYSSYHYVDDNDGVQMATQNLTLTNSRLTRAPADFTIPSMSLRCAWEHWCCGDPSGRIIPYRFLQWQDLSTCGKRKTLSAYR